MAPQNWMTIKEEKPRFHIERGLAGLSAEWFIEVEAYQQAMLDVSWVHEHTTQ